MRLCASMSAFGWRYEAQRIPTGILSNRRLVMAIKPGPKPIAKSTGKPDQRRRDNKETPGNTPSLKPHKHKKGS